ncbi:MAG: orotidine 5'-phosphate decarboxylase [Christensenellaceae bacterium]|nr:orotidine 5'-phosphate decarboxylase [Christensenellaceae bacterium]
MKLQVALDVETMEQAKAILDSAGEYVDIVEVGTILYFYGLPAVAELKKCYPQLEMLADIKIYDGGYETAEAAFRYGADYVTVMGIVDDVTIQGVIKAAREFGKKVVVDMIACNNFAERVKQIDAMKPDIINVHVACDVQSATNTPFEQLNICRMLVKNAQISVAGGVNRHNIGEVAGAKPDIVISGMGIIGQEDPGDAAKAIKDAMLAMG